MFCESCGVELQNPNQIYCPNCGIPLRVKLFEYSEQEMEFQDAKMKINLYELLDSDKILLFVDFRRSRLWIWNGGYTKSLNKLIAAKLAPTISDRYGKEFKIIAFDEGDEPLGFEIMIGLEEPDSIEAQPELTSERTKEDQELFDYLTKKMEWLKEHKSLKELENSLKSIKSMLLKVLSKKGKIYREALPGKFRAELWEISKEDGLPKFKPFVIDYYKRGGISVKIDKYILKIKLTSDKKRKHSQLMWEGNRFFNRGEYEKAARKYEQAVEWSKKLDDKRFISEVNRLAFNSWLSAGKINDAARILEEFNTLNKYLILKRFVKQWNDKGLNEILNQSIDKSLTKEQQKDYTRQLLKMIVERSKEKN